MREGESAEGRGGQESESPRQRALGEREGWGDGWGGEVREGGTAFPPSKFDSMKKFKLNV